MVQLGPLQPASDDEADLALQSRLDEAGHRDLGAVRVEHVLHQRAVVRLGDVGLALHGA